MERSWGTKSENAPSFIRFEFDLRVDLNLEPFGPKFVMVEIVFVATHVNDEPKTHASGRCCT